MTTVYLEELRQVVEIDENNIDIIEVGIAGTNGVGVPAGGTTGQVLAKNSNTNYDTEWVDPSGGGAVDSVNGQTGVVVLGKADIGLGNADNTSDANKPVSIATQAALDGKVDENALISGSTKTKITYDEKGLVTAGEDAGIDDILLLRAKIQEIQKSIVTPTFRIIGDSIASQNNSNNKAASGSTTMAITKYPYWWNMVGWRIGNSINNQSTQSVVDNRRYGSNSGIGGDDMSETDARLQAILDTMPETHLVFCVGTNDINAGVSLATLNSRFVQLTTRTINSGKIPDWVPVFPRNATDGANDWGSVGNTQAEKRKIMVAHNEYREKYCRELGIIYTPAHTKISAADGQAATGMTVDGLHLSAIAGWSVAGDWIQSHEHMLPKRNNNFNAYDVYDASTNPYGNILNGALTGTGGAISSGSGTGTVTGTIPNNFQLQKSTSTTTDCVAAIVSRTDGLPGNVLELTFTSYGTGSVSENWRLNYWTGSTTSLASWAVNGDWLYMGAEIEYVGGHGGVGKSCGARLSNSGATTRTASTISFNNTTKTINDSANGFGSFVANRLAVVSGATNGANNSVFKIVSATAGTLTLDPASVLVTESAGASVTVLIPAMTTTSLGASTTTIPDEDTPIIYNETDPMLMPFTGNLVPRYDIYVNGTIAGTYKLRIARPFLRKIQTPSAVLDFLADDN